MILPFSKLAMCEDAFMLNVLTREHRLRKINFRDFYSLKNKLVQYLYQHGYAIEVVEHKQELICRECDGDGCYRCDDTGIYRTIFLYAFVFKIGCRRFKWHQPKSLVDYPVSVTGPLAAPYNAPPTKSFILMSSIQEMFAFLDLWFGLYLHGVRGLPDVLCYPRSELNYWRGRLFSKNDDMPF